MSHILPEDYIATLRGELPVRWLHQQAVAHLREVCPGCERLAQEGLPLETLGAEAAVPEGEEFQLPALPEDPRTISLEDLAPYENLLSLSREAARVAREDLEELLRLPRNRWRQRVERAWVRYQDRAFAEALIEEARRRVRTAPGEAEALAGLVKLALDREEGRLLLPWARCLVARAQAHRANALRVGGDLVAAGKVFEALRRTLERAPLESPGVVAEIKSLEASLCIGQRNLPRGEELLRAAVSGFHRAGDTSNEGRALIKLANLQQTAGRPEEVAPLLARAKKLFDAAEEPYLHFCCVQGLINAALDLGDPDTAGELLEAEKPAYLETGDDYTVALYGFLRARVRFGHGAFDEAAEGFEVAHQELLNLGRTYDSILAGIYIADALLAAGRTAELRTLAESLVPLFQSRGVERETLASLRLLVEAARKEAVTAVVIEEIREQVIRASQQVEA